MQCVMLLVLWSTAQLSPTSLPAHPLPAGIDCLGRLLGLSLCAATPAPLAAAALQALLLHGELTAALTGAEGVDEEELERQQEAAAAQGGGASAGTGAGTAADLAAMLEQVAVRPELAGAVAGADASSTSAGATLRGPRYLEAWALLLAHLLASAPDAHGRRLLSQALKEAPALVPALLDVLLPLLPLAPASGRRESTGGAGASSQLSARSPSSDDAAGGAAAAGTDDPVAAFASSLFALELPLRPGDEAQARALAQALYWGVLQALPASARLWFGELRDRGTAAAIERYTAAHVTPSLLAAELAAVRGLAAGLSKYDKFSVKASAATREVTAGEHRGAIPGAAARGTDRPRIAACEAASFAIS